MNTRDILPLENILAAAWPPENWQDLTVLVAVSGGADSVALLRALAQLKSQAGGSGRLIVAHLNHRLRPDAEADANWVRDLAGDLGLPYEHHSIDIAEMSAKCGEGLEETARNARYRFFQETAQRVGARYLATGHTADDQIETVLFNLLRGTGLAGLAGMPRARSLGPATSLIRPLLTVRRAEVIQYLDQLQQKYRVDSSNQSSDFTRNRIRNQLLPLLRKEFNADIDRALLRLAAVAGDAHQFIDGLADALLDRCLTNQSHNHEIRLSTAPLIGADRHLMREMFVALWRRRGWPLQNMGFTEWDALAEMALSQNSGAAADSKNAGTKRIFPGNIVVQRLTDGMLLSPLGS